MFRIGGSKSTPPVRNIVGDPKSSLFHMSISGTDIVERVHVQILNAHVFKLPPRQTVSVGWRGSDWKDKVWQGTLKVVVRGDECAILLVDSKDGSLFAVCPVQEGAVERCIDSSRYFVLRIENAKGRHVFIGVAFNERNDAFDFNTALEDSKRERAAAKLPVKPYTGPTKDYSIKEGQKIHVAIPKRDPFDFDEPFEDNGFGEKDSESGHGKISKRNKGKSKKFGMLAPPSKDTPKRL